MNFQKFVMLNKNKIQHEKDLIFLKWKKSVQHQTSELNEIIGLLEESNKGGKNIRGSLVCLGYEMYASKKTKDLYKIAAAYEILHTSLLIHDDIIDKSILRRGKKTLFQELGGNHYGISQAICLGDVGFFLAAKIINETTIPEKIKNTIISQFSQTILNTITGQMLDIKYSHNLSEITEKEVLKISELKTAQYTIAGPLLLGAMLGEANKFFFKQLTIFGEKLGIAFQLQDDLLGLFGDEKKLGKSVSSDIEEGKNTLLIVYARTHATKQQRIAIDSFYGKGKITLKDHSQIKQIIIETGAVEFVKQKIEQYTKEASTMIPKLQVQKTLQNLLKDFIKYLLQRER